MAFQPVRLEPVVRIDESDALIENVRSLVDGYNTFIDSVSKIISTATVSQEKGSGIQNAIGTDNSFSSPLHTVWMMELIWRINATSVRQMDSGFV